MAIDLNDPEINAKDIRSAIAIAEQLRDKGICDLFRGQTECWPLTTSIFRSNVNREQEIQRLNKLANWLYSVIELSSTHNNTDKVLAIAQHYGIGTTFLDFTKNPKVAGFFATHGWDKSKGKRNRGCIVCLNRNRFTESWKDINQRVKTDKGFELVRIVDVDVQNLWRLQNQEGVFLDTKAAPDLLEMFSFFRYIFFPHKPKEDTFFDEEMIYPKKKSHLEILLDEFFENESRERGLERAKQFFGGVIINAKIGSIKGEDKAFKNQLLPKPLDSWHKENLSAWTIEPNENYKNILTKTTLEVKLTVCENCTQQKEFIIQQLVRLLNQDKNIRTLSINWIIKDEFGNDLVMDDEDSDELNLKISCSKIVSYLWDGLRRLPYSDEQIQDCISNYLIGAKYGYTGITEIFGENTGVEFSTNIAINRSTISDSLLFKCIRQDFWDLLNEDEVKRAKSDGGYGILPLLLEPQRLFEFSSFADLFVRNVVPMQPLFSQYDKIIFSPARITIFGIS